MTQHRVPATPLLTKLEIEMIKMPGGFTTGVTYESSLGNGYYTLVVSVGIIDGLKRLLEVLEERQ